VLANEYKLPLESWLLRWHGQDHVTHFLKLLTPSYLWNGWTHLKFCDDMLSRFYLISERNRRTDIFAISISRVSVCRFVETRFAIFTTPLFDGFLRFSVVTPHPSPPNCLTASPTVMPPTSKVTSPFAWVATLITRLYSQIAAGGRLPREGN